MCTASPRAQLHMLHVQDRLRGSTQDFSFTKTRGVAADHTRVSTPGMSHKVNAVHGFAAEKAPRWTADNIGSQHNSSSSRAHATRSRSRGTRCRPVPSVVVPRRSSSSGCCSVSRRRTSGTSDQQQEHRASHGYNDVAYFGFTRDGSPKRRSSSARFSPHAPHQPCAPPTPSAVRVVEQPRPRANALHIIAASTRAGEPVRVATPPLPAQLPALSAVKVSSVPDIRIESSHLGVSALSLQLDSSRHGIMSEPTVSLVVSDTDDDSLQI